MKKVLQLILILFTSFQLMGSLALANSLVTATPVPTGPVNQQQFTFHKKAGGITLLNQLFKTEAEEEESNIPALDFGAICASFYAYTPVFKLDNKHFLVHYAAAIKSKLPALFLLYQVFLL